MLLLFGERFEKGFHVTVEGGGQQLHGRGDRRGLGGFEFFINAAELIG